MYKYIIVFIIFLSLLGCGEGIVEIDSKLYEPRLVIYGFLQPEQKIKYISITRNFPLNQIVNQDSLYLKEAEVVITDLELNKSYKLVFNAQTKTFERLDVVVRKGVSYKLSVSAMLDGNLVEASAITNVPNSIPVIDIARSKLASFNLYEKDENGEYKYFEVCWKFSSDEDCYVFERTSLNIADSNVIYYWPFDVFDLIQNKYGRNSSVKRSVTGCEFIYNGRHTKEYYYKKFEVIDFLYWGRQRFTIYAGDINFRDYITKPKEVTDVDGNQFEPKYHIDGKGIGVFGSMASDTVEVMLYKYGSYGGTVIVTP
jgi:hypothetical protein